MRRLILPVLSATVLLFAFASAAAADPPVVVTGQTPQVNSGYCSFPVYRSDVFKLTTITKPDGTLITHIDRVLTFAANGKTLTSNDHFTRFVDPTAPYIIDIAGHKTITLEVDYGENYDVQDRFNWIEPALLRNRPTTSPSTPTPLARSIRCSRRWASYRPA